MNILDQMKIGHQTFDEISSIKSDILEVFQNFIQRVQRDGSPEMREAALGVLVYASDRSKEGIKIIEMMSARLGIR